MGPFLFCFFFFVSVLATVSVQPSNNSHDFPGSPADRFHLLAVGALNYSSLVPLTQSLLNLSSTEKQAIHITGNLTKVVAEDSIGLNSSSIACIPCDSSDYPGPLKAANTIQTVDSSANRPGAIILYSESATHCNFTSDAAAESYQYIFTVTNSQTASNLQKAFDTSQSATISMSAGGTFDPSSTGGSGSTSGDSPNTAMIILYSITGIITALFLGIIITGAVRAHRHPERYGPRRVAGRPRQSRARGIARAMLEGIPIVKFGDEPPKDGVEAAKRDVEMASTDNEGREHSPSPDDTADVHHTTPHETEISTTEHGDEPPTPAEPKTDATPVTEAGNFSCPICTDDFIKGQDLRVLPCSHQFHPECVDPWLLTVSGTCPLCRIDLNPAKEGENTEQQDGENAEHTEETPAEEPASPTADASSHRHNRFTNYLNARRMRNASVEERLAALRRVREANQSNGAAPTNRRGLSIRLRERFRVRTRAHGVENQTDDSGTSTPIPAVPAVPEVPAAAHVAESEHTH